MVRRKARISALVLGMRFFGQLLFRRGREVVELLMRHLQQPTIFRFQFVWVMLRNGHGPALLDRQRGHY